MSFARKKAYFSTNLTQLNSLFVCYERAKAKIWSFFGESISIFLWCSLFSFAFFVYQQFCCTLYHPSFAQNCGWLTFQERGKFNLKTVVCKQRNWQWTVSVTLSGLVRISKTLYRWKHLSLLMLFLTNFYPASRGPWISPGKA